MVIACDPYVSTMQEAEGFMHDSDKQKSKGGIFE